MVLTKDISKMVKNDAMSFFDRFFDGKLVYKILNPLDEGWYYYDIPVSEAKGGTFFKEEKAIYHVRWIRKAINSNQFRKEYLP
jgi:hypothetical protein